MGLMTGKQYRDSLRQLKPVVYYMGEKVDNLVDHPSFVPHVNAAALTYDMAWAPEFEELLTTKSHLNKEKINRFTHIHHSHDDLVKKVKMLRAIGQQTGSCFQRCVGHDGMNAGFSTTYDIDQKYGTDYHKRFLKFLKEVQSRDLMVSGAMTDPKGDRSLRPAEQPDPDQYLRVVDGGTAGNCLRRQPGLPLDEKENVTPARRREPRPEPGRIASGDCPA